MGKQAVALNLFYDADWNTAPAYEREVIELSRGAGSEGAAAPPSEASATIDNRSGNYNPRNPTSPLWGLAGRNTPMQVVMRPGVDDVVRSTTEAASWAPQRSLSKRDAWTPVKGGGIMRRLGQGNTPLRSPAYRAITAPSNDSTLIEYVPFEEESASTSVTSWRGGRVTLSGAVSLGGDTGSASSARLAVLGAAGKVVVEIPTYASSEHKVINLFRIPSGGLVDMSTMLRIEFLGGTISHCDLKWSTGNGLRIEFYGPLGALVETLGPIAWGAYISDAEEFFSSIELVQNGANVDVLHLILNVPRGTTGIPTDTVTGQTIGRIVRLTYGLSDVEGMAVGQIAVGNDQGAFPNYISPVNDSLATQGFAGERAGLRAERLGDEEGIAVTWIGDPEDTSPMGAQPSLAFLDLLAECSRTDDGLMFEPIDTLGVAIRGGRDLYNRDPLATFDFSVRGISHPLAPALDDRSIRNDVTAKRRGGGEYRAQKLTGPLNVSDPVADPEGVGRYDTQVDVNTETTEALVDVAHWALHRGTVEDTRYPSITVDLVAVPSLVADVEALDIGDRITLDGLPADWQPGGSAELVILGIREAIGTHSRKVTFNAIPSTPFEIGIVGADDGSVDLRGQAVDTDCSTLDDALTTTTNAFDVTSTNGVRWTTNPDDWSTLLHGSGRWGAGLFIVYGGEVMRVTNITGSGATQGFQVVRSINGVVKSHAAGGLVHVDRPVVVGR